jgi:hypothetical protein
MSTCIPNLRHSFLTICEIIHSKVKEEFFFLVPKGDGSIFKAKKTTFKSRFGMSLFRFLFLSELGTCSQNFMPMRGEEP